MAAESGLEDALGVPGVGERAEAEQARWPTEVDAELVEQLGHEHEGDAGDDRASTERAPMVTTTTTQTRPKKVTKLAG